MSSLPDEIREKIKRLISETTDETFDLVVNLSGKYLSKKIGDAKRKAEPHQCCFDCYTDPNSCEEAEKNWMEED